MENTTVKTNLKYNGMEEFGTHVPCMDGQCLPQNTSIIKLKSQCHVKDAYL